MTLKIQKKEGPVFAADLEQLKVIATKPPKQRTVLTGQLFMCSMEQLRPQEGVIAQSPRSSSRQVPWARKGGGVLNLALDKEAVNTLVRARIKPLFAIDALLRYGQKLNRLEDALLLSAAASTTAALVTVLHFKKGTLVAYSEFVLAHPSAHTYDADLHVLLEGLRIKHLSAVFHWCGPLPMPRSQTFINAHPQVWQLASTQTVTRSGRAKFLPRHGLSLFITLSAMAGYIVALYVPYQEYQKAARELSTENARLQGEYTFASERLTLLEARKEFFKGATLTVNRLRLFQAVLSVLAQQDALVLKEAQLVATPGALLPAGAVGTTAYAPDFDLTIEVPKVAELTVLEQSEPLLRRLSDTLGMSLRLSVTGGFREVSNATDKAPKRAYRIQGEFGRAS